MLPHWKEHTLTVPSPRGEFITHYTRTGEGSGKPAMVLVIAIPAAAPGLR